MLDEITFLVGESEQTSPLRIHAGTMTVLVGPNNSGKSLTLREIFDFISLSVGGVLTEGEYVFHIIDSICPSLPPAGELQKVILKDIESDLGPFRKTIQAVTETNPGTLLDNIDLSRLGSIFDVLQKLGHLRSLAEDGKIDPSLLNVVNKNELTRQPTLVAMAIEFLKQLIAHLERNQEALARFTAQGAESPIIRLIANKILRMEGYLGHYAPYTILLDGTSRLRLTNPQPTANLREPLDEASKNMMMRLFYRPDEMEHLRSIVFDAFGRYLALDLTGMTSCRFVLSDKHPGEYEKAFGSQGAREYFAQANDISTCSDGVRSYIGLHATLLSHDYRVILMDEPEAFLHPPLARRLGYNLTRLASKRGASIVAATHSPDFLMGCIEAQQTTNIIRLGFRNGQGTARALPANNLQEIMNDPLLRSTRVLSALFHQSAIVCEGDSDRAFYDEINERLRVEVEHSQVDRIYAKDCLFLHAHSKQAVPKLLGALRRMGIPSIGIVDLDLLKDQTVATELAKCAGAGDGTCHAIGQFRGDLYKAFEREASKSGSSGNQLKNELSALIKSGGINNLTQDRDRSDLKEFLRLMANQGIYIPEKGELETWLSDLSKGLPKERWLESMFIKMGSLNEPATYLRPQEGDIWAFVENMAQWLNEHAVLPPKIELPAKATTS